MARTCTCKEMVYGGIDLIDYINYKLRNEEFLFKKDP